MNREKSIFIKTDPHFDSEYEGIENDSFGGPQMGLRTDKKLENPFHVTSLREDPEMKRFSKWFDGKLPEEKGDDGQ
ncbi:hypothetical protein ACQKP0_02365 [Heyndrickxia sp. NPDC080065]|uniref:hypothetical protein n=1 Tax=Heyndrickxia sp. NPDC080065 TaxID=3390568 RepID=UPI003D08D34A